ncbi:uncharacterized protein N7459_003274 [Penicillium hispanicum]|uniref:uncharacterized protein n=1 Tax=Penicillium hispanicum TaxID=1080232 RepID=UPI00253F9C00|nr:uncharacterized protein N7459_003274 [Penicillium hispanicum]KAJ5587509.1 hypothetical protein N7459_003274 [Penicillium hispanicum]
MTTSHFDNGDSKAVQDKPIGPPSLPNLSPPSSQPAQHAEFPSTVLSQQPNQSLGLEKHPSSVVYEGYQFFKADPIPGQKATWTRVERTEMHLTQSEFYKLVQKRANKVSAAQQYQNLSDTRRAHVNQLIHEQRRLDPSGEWSCVYAKERDRPAKARNAHRDDYETVSMDIILMKRPMKTKSYPRTPMGELVDLNVPLRHNGIEAHKLHRMQSNVMSPERRSEMAPPRYPSMQASAHPLTPGTVVGSDCVVQGPLPRPVPVTGSLRQLDLGPAQIVEGYEDTIALHASAARTHRNLDCESVDWSSEADSSDDEGSVTSDESQSDMSSALDDEDMDCEYQGPLQPPTIPRKHSCSPTRRDPGFGAHYRRRSSSRHIERRDRLSGLRYHNIEMMPATHYVSARRARSSRAGIQDPVSREKKYRIKRMDDEEMRNRLLDCEARLEQWEKAFEQQSRIRQTNMPEPPQLQRCQSFYDFSSMRHCGCDCSKNSKMANAD